MNPHKYREEIRRILHGDPYDEVHFGSLLEQRELLKPPAVIFPCNTCGRDVSYTCVNGFQQEPNPRYAKASRQRGPIPEEEVRPGVFVGVYQCTVCEADGFGFSSQIEFVLKVSLNRNSEGRTHSIMKIGQAPRNKIRPPRWLEQNYEELAPLYWRGRACESHRFGIGAFAYYRKILEAVTDELLEGLAELTDTEELSAKIETAKQAHRASEKFEVLRGALPERLRPNGTDPFASLYGLASEALHSGGLSESEALEEAAGARLSLEFLLQEIAAHRKNQREFADRLREQQERKAKRKEEAQ